jgi:hypothetical protein
MEIHVRARDMKHRRIVLTIDMDILRGASPRVRLLLWSMPSSLVWGSESASNAASSVIS